MKEAPDPQSDAPEEERERWEVLTQLEDWLTPQAVLDNVDWVSRNELSGNSLTRVGNYSVTA